MCPPIKKQPNEKNKKPFGIILCCISILILSLFAGAEEGPDREDLHKKADFSPIESLGPFKKDSDYRKIPVFENLDLIYSKNFESFAGKLSECAHQIDSELRDVFPSHPYFRKNSVFFPSSRWQVPFASAQIHPLTFIKIHPSLSVHFMDNLSIFHWPQLALIHEMTHIYQFAQNSQLDRRLWSILGPLSYRNILLSSWILEGSAILNESIYGSGGRLFSGWVRAFVLSQIQQGISLKRLLKPYNDPFSIREKYLHGGYFFAYLLSQNQLQPRGPLFAKSGKYLPIGFYGLNEALKRTFKQSLETLFAQYKAYYYPLAQQQKSSPEKAILKSKISEPINSDKKQIHFLISDMKSPPQLIVFDKETRKIRKRKVALPLGKIFYKQGQYYSAGKQRISSTSIEYSLFKEGFQPVKKYNSQYVMDFHKNKFIALDSRQSLTQNSLYINNVFFDNSHSSAVMDHEGRAYYFKQEKDIRTLYRDKKPLLSLKTHYSYPVEADEGGLYFIGATKYGSSLFVFRESEGIFRLSLSDTINSARKIKGNEFLISEIRPDHYAYKIISTQEVPEMPVSYSYSFKKNILCEDTFADTEKLALPTPPISLAEETPNEEELALSNLSHSLVEEAPDELSRLLELEEKGWPKDKSTKLKNPLIKKPTQNYNSLSNLQLKNMFLSAYTDVISPLAPHFAGTFQWTDPLRWSELSLFSLFGSKQKRMGLSYSYKKYRPILSLSFIYSEEKLNFLKKSDTYRIQTFKDIGFLTEEDMFYSSPLKDQKKKNFLFYRSRALNISLDYPLILRHYWALSLSNSLQIGQKQFNDDSKYFYILSNKANNWRNYFQHTGSLKYSYKKRYKYSYSFYQKRMASFSLNSLWTKLSPQPFLSWKTEGHIMETLGGEWFLSLNGTVKTNLWDRSPKFPLSKMENGTILNYSSFKQDFQNLYKLDSQLLKAFNLSYYPLKLPFSIRRWAPLAGGSFLFTQREGKKSRAFLIPFAGMEWEMSFNEKTLVRMGLSAEYVFEFVNYPIFNSALRLSPLSRSKDKISLAPFHYSFWLKSAL